MISSAPSAASIATATSRLSSGPAFACSGGSAGAGTAPSLTETGPKLVGQWMDLTSALNRIASVTGASRETVEELVRPIVQTLMHQADMVARSEEIVPWLDAVAIAAEDCSDSDMELINGLVRLRGELARAGR